MSRTLKALVLLLLVDCAAYAGIFGLLQLTSAELLCDRVEVNTANCGEPLYLEDFTTRANQLLLGVTLIAALTTLAWIIAAYWLGDFGSPVRLRRQGVTWWVTAGLGAVAAAAFGYYRASLLDALSSNAWVGVISLSALVGLVTHFLGSVFATPWVVRGQVPGAHWLGGRWRFP